MEKNEKCFGEFCLPNTKNRLNDEQIILQGLATSSDDAAPSSVQLETCHVGKCETGQIIDDHRILRGILKRPEPIPAAGRGRYFSESQVDDFSTSRHHQLSEADTTETEQHAEIRCVHFSDVVRRQLYRANSSIVGQATKNRKKAEKKRQSAERRKSEGDAAHDDVGRFSSSHDDSGLGSVSSSTVTDDESALPLSSDVGSFDDELEDSPLSRPTSEQETSDSAHDDSGLCSSLEERVTISSVSSRKNTKKKKSTRKSKSTLVGTPQFKIDI